MHNVLTVRTHIEGDGAPNKNIGQGSCYQANDSYYYDTLRRAHNVV